MNDKKQTVEMSGKECEFTRKDPLDELLSLIKPCPNIGDYKEERHKYLDERYGVLSYYMEGLL